jgi:hypothetical protein
VNAAEKRLKAANTAVEEARAAYANAQAELRALAAREADVAASIETTVADSVRGGKPVDVADARQHLRDVVDQRATAATVTFTPEQVIREREQERDRVIADEFMEIAPGVARDGHDILDAKAEAWQGLPGCRRAPLDPAERQLRARWEQLRAPLPALIRPPSPLAGPAGSILGARPLRRRSVVAAVGGRDRRAVAGDGGTRSPTAANPQHAIGVGRTP